MKRKIVRMKTPEPFDEDMPRGRVTILPDFLPPPEELFPDDYTLKITIAIDVKTIKLFKVAAEKHGFKYQRMMREVLKRYAERLEPKPSRDRPLRRRSKRS